MLSIVPKGLQLLGLGPLFNAASTLIETGPLDSLISSDAYRGPLDVFGGGGDQAGNRNSPITGNFISNVSNARRAVQPLSMWNAIICGEPPPSIEPDEQRGRRQDFAAMYQRGNGCNFEDIAQLLTFKDGKLTLDSKELDRRLDMILGPVKNLLDADKKDMMMGAFVSALGLDPNLVQVVVDSSETLLDADNYSDAESFTKMLGQIANNDELAYVFDLGAEFAILDTMVNQAISLGIPQAIDHLLNEYKSDKQKCQTLLRNARQAARMSDITTLEKVVDNCGAGALLDQHPNIIEVLLRSYSIPRNTSKADYSEKLNELLNLLNKIDSNWAYKDFHCKDSSGQVYTHDATKLGIFTKASDDCKKLLRRSDEFRGAVMIAHKYSKRNIDLLVKKHYPQIVLH